MMKVILMLLIPLLSVSAETEYNGPGKSGEFTISVVNGRLVCGKGEIRHMLPIVVNVTTADNKPVKGAIAAIKRIQTDGYTEEDVRATKNSSTDSAGHITLYCPCGIDDSDPKKPKLQILGAITVIAKGYETTAIEFETYFAGIELPVNEKAALAAHLALKKKGEK